jgi:hypothetical protein
MIKVIMEPFKIIKAFGEENVTKFIDMIHNIFNIRIKDCNITNLSGRYTLKTDTYEFEYTIVDEGSNKTTPDYYMYTDDKNYFIEETSCELSSSGNNTQLQRSSKNNSARIHDTCIYYCSGNEECDLRKKKADCYAFRLWKTSNVKVFFKNKFTMDSYDKLLPYSSIEELVSHYRETVPKTKRDILSYNKDLNIINLKLNVLMSKYNLIKAKKSLDHDPGKGSLCLLLLAIDNLISKKPTSKKPTIILENIAHEQKQIVYNSSGNKILRTLKNYMDNGYNIQFKFSQEYKDIKIDMRKINSYESICPFKDLPSSSEKIISMYHSLKKELFNNIIFENHARSENSKIRYKLNTLVFPKLKRAKPDIILETIKNIEIIEAECYDNLKKGQAQIVGWSNNKKLYEFYKKTCSFEKDLEIYLELYDSNDRFNGDFSDPKYKNVKYIMNTKCRWFENKNYEPLQFQDIKLI